MDDILREIATGFEGHFMRALFISGALALLVTGVVGFAWWRSRRWMTNRATGRTAPMPHVAMFREDPAAPGRTTGNSAHGRASGEDRPGGRSSTGPDEQPGARFVREAAARAASLREAWDRSYREARGGDVAASAAPSAPGGTPLDVLIQELLTEQRETNALLREIAAQLAKPER